MHALPKKNNYDKIKNDLKQNKIVFTGEDVMILSNRKSEPFTTTAQPFRRGYTEYVPCEALRPMIRCFWTSMEQAGRLIIPDFCADIIFNLAGQNVCFSGVSDRPFVSGRTEESFGIRFYAWTAELFAEDSLRGTLNGGFEIGEHFHRIERELLPQIIEAGTTAQRIALSERFFLRHLRERHNRLYDEAVGELMKTRGVCTVGELSKELHISVRQLERTFLEYSGLSPKKTAALIRYQCIWQEILFGRTFNMADKVLEYGYTDQSHLLNDFRRFHTMYPEQARKNALKDVAFLQDNAHSL